MLMRGGIAFWYPYRDRTLHHYKTAPKSPSAVDIWELEENNIPEWRRIGLRIQGVPRGAYLLYVTLGATQKMEP